MIEYSLRPIADEDAGLLYRIYASTREEELAVVPWRPEEKAAFLQQQFQAQHAHYTAHYVGASFDLILIDGVPAGRLYVFRTPRELRIMDIALLPEFRGRGVGERVLRDVFAEADRDGKITSIHVEFFNPARRLYDRLGFRAIDQGEETPAYVLMERPPASQHAIG